MRDLYEAYMKKVTDGFIDMQRDSIDTSMGHDRDSAFYTVVWEGGLDYKFDTDPGLYMKGITREEAKQFNARMARAYLDQNSMTYDDWCRRNKIVTQLEEWAQGNSGVMNFLVIIYSPERVNLKDSLTIIETIKVSPSLRGQNLYNLFYVLGKGEITYVAQLCRDIPDDVLEDAAGREDMSGADLITDYIIQESQ